MSNSVSLEHMQADVASSRVRQFGANSNSVLRRNSSQRYLSLLLSQQPANTCASLAVMILVGLFQGAGVLLLLPMFEIVGVSQSSAVPHQTSMGIGWLFDVFMLPHTLAAALGLFVAIAGGYAVLVHWQTVLNARLQQQFIRFLQNRLYASIVSAKWGFYVRTRTSDFTHALTNDIARVSAGTTFLPRLVGSAILVAVHITLSLALSPIMTLVTLASTLLLWPLLSLQNRRTQRSGEHVSHFTRSFYARITDHLAGMKDAKCMGEQRRHIQAFEDLTGTMNQAHQQYMQTTATTALIYTLGSVVILAGLVWIAVEVLRLPAAELLVLVFLFSRLLPRLKELHASWQQVLHMLPAFDAVEALQAQCDAEREPAECKLASPMKPETGIEFRGVSFRYGVNHPTAQSTGTLSLDNVTLTIPAFRTTAVVGPSGAGKSTLADVLLGLLTPLAGEILIDGRVLSSDTAFDWRSNVGYVGQETFLLHDTIRANLLASRPGATEDELWESLKLAAADRFVGELPLKMETIVGDRGIRLSGGERQRIALARALLRRPSVLVLDEATSALDSEHQQQIQDAIQMLHGELTLVIIAHRLSTIRHADQIVVLDGGRIVECGRYEELIARPSGRFRSLALCDDPELNNIGPEAKFAA